MTEHQEETGMVHVDESGNPAMEIIPPGVTVQRGVELANELDALISDPKREMTVKIMGRKHLNISAWTTLANMAGLAIRTVYVKCVTEGTFVEVWVGKDQNRRQETIELVAYEAMVEVVDKNNLVVASAIASAGTDEGPSLGQKGWGKRNAAMAFAQTRASGRALKHYLGWIPALSGLETTPAEEMTGSDYGPRNQPPDGPAQQQSRGRTQPQRQSRPQQQSRQATQNGDESYHKLLSQAMIQASNFEGDMDNKTLMECFSSVKATPADVVEALGVDDQGNVLKTVEAWVGGAGYDPAEVEVTGGRTNIGAARVAIRFLFNRETARLRPNPQDAVEPTAEQAEQAPGEKEVVGGEVVEEEAETEG